jgi:hypothetical protein
VKFRYLLVQLEGNYTLVGAEVTPLEGSLEFTIKSGAKICVLRAANASIKSSWLRCICRQIAILSRRGHSVVATLRVKSNSSTPTGTGPNSVKSNTSTPNSVMQMGFFPSSSSVSSTSGPMTPTNTHALAAAHSVAATIHAVSDKLFSASPLPNPKGTGSTNSSVSNSSEKPPAPESTTHKDSKHKHAHKPKAAHSHDADMFGEMDVIEDDSAHGVSDYSDSDDEDGHNEQSNTTTADVSKQIPRAGTGYVNPTHLSPPVAAPTYTSSPINVNAKHSYVPTNTPRTLPKSPSTLMRAASMKVLSTPMKDTEDEYALGTMSVSRICCVIFSVTCVLIYLTCFTVIAPLSTIDITRKGRFQTEFCPPKGFDAGIAHRGKEGRAPQSQLLHPFHLQIQYIM